MNKLLCGFVTMAIALGSLNASAGGDDRSSGKNKGGDHGGNRPGQTGSQSRGVSWEEFRERCANPDKFAGDIQRDPRQIVVQCSDFQREFVAAAPGEIPLPGHRRVLTRVFSDKFRVEGQPMELELANKGGSCLKFKEIEKNLAVERPLNCAEVLGMKGGVEEYCVSALNAAKAANPKLITANETGTVIDTCGSGAGVAKSDTDSGQNGKGPKGRWK